MTVSKPETVEVTQSERDLLEQLSWLTYIFDETGPNPLAVTLLKRHRLNATPSRQDGLREALESFAKLEIPAKRKGNAGFYSIPFERITKARAALAATAGTPDGRYRRVVETLAKADCECDPAYSTRTCLSCNARAALSDTPPPDNEETLAPDVRRLVVAARQTLECQDGENLQELDQASEAFATRVPWDDEPEGGE